MSVRGADRVLPPTTAANAARRARRSVVRPRRWQTYEPIVIGTASVIIVLTVWQAIAILGLVPKLFLPAPTDVALAFVDLFRGDEIWIDMATSGEELAMGYGAAIVIGLVVGMLMGWYTRVQYALDPFVNFFYSTPRVALAPLFIIALGIGIQSKLAVIFLGALFPIIINTMAGVRNTDGVLLRVARSFNASDSLIFRRLVLPGSVPFILTGFRLGVGHAITGLVVAELIGAQHGVGQLIANAGQMFQMPKMFAGVIIIAGFGMVLTNALQRIERRFQAWRPQMK